MVLFLLDDFFAVDVEVANAAPGLAATTPTALTLKAIRRDRMIVMSFIVDNSKKVRAEKYRVVHSLCQTN